MPFWKQHLAMACCGVFGGMVCLLAMGICSLLPLRPALIASITFFSACSGFFISSYLVNQWINTNENSSTDAQPVGLVTLVARIVVWTFGLVLLGFCFVGFLVGGK